MKKRLLSGLLVLVMVLTMLPMTVLASDGESSSVTVSGTIKYVFDDTVIDTDTEPVSEGSSNNQPTAIFNVKSFNGTAPDGKHFVKWVGSQNDEYPKNALGTIEIYSGHTYTLKAVFEACTDDGYGKCVTCEACLHAKAEDGEHCLEDNCTHNGCDNCKGPAVTVKPSTVIYYDENGNEYFTETVYAKESENAAFQVIDYSASKGKHFLGWKSGYDTSDNPENYYQKDSIAQVGNGDNLKMYAIVADCDYAGTDKCPTCGLCKHTKGEDNYCTTSDCTHGASCSCGGAKPAPAPTTYTVYAKSGKNGSVTRDGEYVSVTADSDYTIWFYPKKGYEVSAVYVDGLLVNYGGVCYTHHWDCDGCHDCDWIDWSHWYDCDYYWCDHDHCWYDHDYCDDCWYDHYYCDYYYGPIYWDDWQDGITLYDIDRDYTVYVEFAAIDSGCPSEYYTDLDTDEWYHEATDFVIEKGLMKGSGYKTFEPYGKTTRSELVTMLYRLAGEPKVSGESEFKDVKDDQWYTDAILWATKKGIVEGHGNGYFGVEDAVTREETVTILYRYAKAVGLSVSKLADLDDFVDADKVSDFAEEPFGWAVQKDIVKGDTAAGGKLKLNPLGATERVEMAALLMRFAKLVG